MRQKICSLFIIFLILICSLPVSAQEVNPAEIMESLSVELSCDTESAEYGKAITVTAKITNVSLYVVGTSQWTVNETPIEGYYDSMYDLFVNKETAFVYTPSFYKGMVPSVTVHFDIAYGGILKRFTKDINLTQYPDEFYEKLDKEQAMSAVSDVKIEATVLRDTYGYDNSSLKGEKILIPKGEKVIYRDHNEEYSAYIKRSDGSHCWVKYYDIQVSRKNYTVFSDHAPEVKEMFVNKMNYQSDTGYLVWINLERQKVNIFMGSEGNWKLIQSFTCATGANITPTPMGEYTYCARQDSWIKPEYIVRPILYINIYRGLAFHSRTYSPYNGALLDSTMGTPVSHGCIRMLDDDVNWMQYYLTFNTKVVVY